MIRRLFPADHLPAGDLGSTLDAAYWAADVDGQFVRSVMISSADGRCAVGGRSGSLGNDTDTTLFAVLRAQADVLLVGSSTVRAERYAGDRPTEPMRALRSAHGLASAPRIAVVTARLSLDVDAPVFTDTEVRPLVVTCRSAPAAKLEALRAVSDVVVAGDDRVDIAVALAELAASGLHRVSCEGGPSLLAEVAATGRLDELALTIAPTLIGGDAPRILTGAQLRPPEHLELRQVLQNGVLFLRYRRRP